MKTLVFIVGLTLLTVIMYVAEKRIEMRNKQFDMELKEDNIFMEMEKLENELSERELEFSIEKAVDKLLNVMPKESYDVVENPQHYCSGAHECIDVMEEMFGTSAVIDFCRCNIFKYRFRAAQKNGEEDIKKAEWYEEKLMELNKKKNENNALWV